MNTATADGIVVLGMYPFPHVRPATEQLWSAVRGHLGFGPAAITDGDLHGLWTRPDLLLGQTCGWPLVTALPDVTVVGAFELTIGEAEGTGYHSVLIGSRQADLHALAAEGPVAANAPDSLSGWISLCSALGDVPTNVTWTGAHVASLRAVANGSCSLASIDSLTFELVLEAEPELAAAVHRVGEGPLVPTLPLIVGSNFAERLGDLRAAIAAAVADPKLADALRTLRVRAFRPLERADYLPLLSLAHPSLR